LQAILVGGLCPGTEDPASCEAGLPGLWNDIAALLWPGYWDPTAEWMCADFCAAPEDTAMTCDDCKMGIQAGIDQLLAPETIDVIVENIAPQICANNPTEECPIAVDAIIRNGLPLLAGAGADADFAQVIFNAEFNAFRYNFCDRFLKMNHICKTFIKIGKQ